MLLHDDVLDKAWVELGRIGIVLALINDHELGGRVCIESGCLVSIVAVL